MNNHPFHLVDMSPWPITGSIGVMTLVSGLTMWFHKESFNLLIIGTLIIFFTMIQWWRDITRESTFQGFHTKKVILSMKIGMLLFILSEILFFLSFFWALFYSMLSPSIEMGLKWPPLGIKPFNPMNIPMLNTMILLSSGISLTWTHNSLIYKNFTYSIQSIFITMFLGMYFTILQIYEYYKSSFTISDSVYGSLFFVMTGFHGLHVIIGTIFISIMSMRILYLHQSSNHHVGFEASAWYWHFVDLVWLILYITIYWWGM
nr:cytochrome c oxidase subunit III [Subulatus sp.]